MEMLRFLNQGWVGAVIGAIGIIIGFILYKTSRVNPQLAHQDSSIRLVGRKEQALPREVKILFKNRKVERLTKTLITLWNLGKAKVEGIDIVSSDPLRIEVSKGSEVLSVNISKETRKASKFKAKINPNSSNEVICNFDYLEPNDGVAIELLHTDERRYPKVLGTIRGMPKGIIDCGVIPPAKQMRGLKFKLPFKVKYVVIAALLYAIFTIAIGFLKLQYPDSSTSTDQFNPYWFNIVAGSLLVIMSLYTLRRLRRRFPKSLDTTDDYKE